MLAKTASLPAIVVSQPPLAARIESQGRSTRRPIAPVQIDRKRVGGLVLTRHLGESIMLDDSTEVEVVGIRSGTVRLRINAPRSLAVHRREVFEAIRTAPRPGTSANASRPKSDQVGQGALVLTRHETESIMIGEEIEVIIDDVRPSTIRLRVVAPRHVQVHRREVFEEIQRGHLAHPLGLEA